MPREDDDPFRDVDYGPTEPGQPPKVCSRCGKTLRSHEAFWVPLAGTGRVLCPPCYEIRRRSG